MWFFTRTKKEKKIINEGLNTQQKLTAYRNKVVNYKAKRLRLRKSGADENKINKVNDIIGYYRHLIRMHGGKI